MIYGLPVECRSTHSHSNEFEEYTYLEFVTFLEDFGPYKQGDMCGQLFIDLCAGTLTEFNEGAEIVRKTKIKLSPE